MGFPGEDEEAYRHLVNFVKEMRFERMGAFAYSEEEGTFAAKHFADSISEEVKAQRLDELMQIQEQISQEIQEEKIGKTLKVIIDTDDSNYYYGRTQWDSPEVDPEVLIAKDQKLEIGNFYQVEITDATPFELFGKVL